MLHAAPPQLTSWTRLRCSCSCCRGWRRRDQCVLSSAESNRRGTVHKGQSLHPWLVHISRRCSATRLATSGTGTFAASVCCQSPTEHRQEPISQIRSRFDQHSTKHIRPTSAGAGRKAPKGPTRRPPVTALAGRTTAAGRTTMTSAVARAQGATHAQAGSSGRPVCGAAEVCPQLQASAAAAATAECARCCCCARRIRQDRQRAASATER